MPAALFPKEGPSRPAARSGDCGSKARVRRPPVQPVDTGSRQKRPRVARADLAIATLQGSILLTVVAVVTVLLWSQRATRARDSGLMDSQERSRLPLTLPGQVARRERSPRGPTKSVVDPERVRSVLPAGRTFEIRVKGGLTATVDRRDYGLQGHENLAFAFEVTSRRTIERNDGRRLVALLHFDRVRMAKLLSAVDDLKIDLGAPGEPILDALDDLAPDAGFAVVDVAPVADALLGLRARPVVESPTSRAFLETDPLCGKTVRLTYQAGRGVESIEPIGCVLDHWQTRFLFQTALLSDYFLLPPDQDAAGQIWRVDARQLTGYLDPSIRGLPEGEVTLRSTGLHQRREKRCCTLRLEGDTMDVLSCVFPGAPVGRFRPAGTVRLDLSQGRVETAQLSWRIGYVNSSQSRLLFESDLRGRPALQVAYWCKLR